MTKPHTLIIIGGGAAGFFAALAAKEADATASVLLLERSSTLLGKVRISGGGRCNVTHACFDPRMLVQNYPRGNKALMGPFTRFQPRDTMQWYAARGVELKIEDDGRVFPVSDNSQTIIDCLVGEARKNGVEVRLKQQLEKIERLDDHFCLTLASGEVLTCQSLLLATGSQPQGHLLAKSLGHTIQEPVPSLFTFNIPSSPLVELAGIVIDPVAIHLVDSSFMQSGPLLITHWGFSGPAALKLSAWGARLLHEKKYNVKLSVDWLPKFSKEQLFEALKSMRQQNPVQNIGTNNPFELPKNFWKLLVQLAIGDNKKRLADVSNEALQQLTAKLKGDLYAVEGKTTHKEEFVTCGGVNLDEVNFKTMESRKCKGLYFAGEILDIDAVTGGFNFQNAWTTGWISGQAAVAGT